jgi:8-oxo-dGTP pyrophosphatase MutT (NUDIX family)
VTHKPVVESAICLQSWQRDWLAVFAHYALRHPDEGVVAQQFADFVAAHADAAERRLAVGHLTGSAWLVSADRTRVLLTHHRKLNRWLQLGGHADGDVDLARVALREAQEESGLCGLAIEPEIYDLDRHKISARGSEPAHWHYDVRYIVRAGGGEDCVVSHESHALAWCNIAALAADATADASLRRMARKWLDR